MKITKKQLVNKLLTGLERLNYIYFTDNKSDWQSLFVKRLDKNFYLTLGILRHRFHDNRFTGDFYLSKTTTLGALWGDIPKEIYTRPGFLVSEDERNKYCNGQINSRGVKDIWWDAESSVDVVNFLKIIEIAENRLITDVELYAKINASKEVAILRDYANSVIALVREGVGEVDCTYTPAKNVDGVPSDWFQAAEFILRSTSATVNAHTVQRLAKDAFRQFNLQRD